VESCLAPDVSTADGKHAAEEGFLHKIGGNIKRREKTGKPGRLRGPMTDVTCGNQAGQQAADDG